MPQFIISNIDLGWTKKNLSNILWHGGVLAVAAFLTYLIEQLPGANFGQGTPGVVFIISFVLKSALEYVKKG